MQLSAMCQQQITSAYKAMASAPNIAARRRQCIRSIAIINIKLLGPVNVHHSLSYRVHTQVHIHVDLCVLYLMEIQRLITILQIVCIHNIKLDSKYNGWQNNKVFESTNCSLQKFI